MEPHSRIREMEWLTPDIDHCAVDIDNIYWSSTDH